MRRLAWLVLVCGCHSSAGPDSASPPTPPTATCPATHLADGPACVPRFDGCAEGEVPSLGGGCTPVGVPKDGCAPGFTHDGKSGCAPVLPPASCPPGQLAVPGDTACAEVAPCGDGTFGAIADGPSMAYVDPAAAPGGTGSRAAPFTTLAAALATDAGTIALAEGTYTGDVVLGKPRKLIGRCPAKVRIVGVASADVDAAVSLSSNTTLSGVSITGPGCGVRVEFDSTNVVVENAWIHGTGSNGVWVRRSPSTVLRRLLVEDAFEFGVVAVGSKAELIGSLIRDVRPGTATAAGVQANPDLVGKVEGSVTVTRSVVERVPNAGVLALSATVTVDGSVVRDATSFGDGAQGFGAAAFSNAKWPTPAKLVLRRSLLAHNSDAGVMLHSADATIEGTVIRDTVANKDGTYGRGVVAQALTRTIRLELRDSLVERNRETGVDIDFDTDALIERTVIRDTVQHDEEGRGIFAEVALGSDVSRPPPRLVVRQVFVARNPCGGIVSTGSLDLQGSRLTGNGGFGVTNRGGAARLRSVLIDHTVALANGKDGHGAYAEADERGVATTLDLADTLIDGARKAGIGTFGSALNLTSSAVRNVTVELATGQAGIGVAVHSDPFGKECPLAVRATLIERVVTAGIHVAGCKGTLDGVHVRGVAALANGNFGDGLIVTGHPVPVLTTSDLTVTGSVFEKNARAGIALFGSDLALSGSWVQCNALNLDVEPFALWNGVDAPLMHAFTLRDEGGNQCGCDAPGLCAASSTHLAPATAVERPTK